MNTRRIGLKQLMLFLTFMSAQICANAQKVTIDGLKYYLYADTHEAAIDNGNGWGGELTLPSEVSYNGDTYIVNGIAWSAFTNCKELTKVRIPKTIDHVIHHVLKDGPATGGAVSPDFMNPFGGCTALEAIEVDEDNPIMKSVGGILFSKDGTGLYAYPAGIKAERYAVPDGVTWIGGNAFVSNEHIVSLEMPATVEKLCSSFSGCKRLANVKLSENLTYIDSYQFDECI